MDIKVYFFAVLYLTNNYTYIKLREFILYKYKRLYVI